MSLSVLEGLGVSWGVLECLGVSRSVECLGVSRSVLESHEVFWITELINITYNLLAVEIGIMDVIQFSWTAN